MRSIDEPWQTSSQMQKCADLLTRMRSSTVPIELKTYISCRKILSLCEDIPPVGLNYWWKNPSDTYTSKNLKGIEIALPFGSIWVDNKGRYRSNLSGDSSWCVTSMQVKSFNKIKAELEKFDV